mgnify:CR=1 FL=1
MTDAADGGVELVPSTDRSIVHRQKIETETESAPVSLSLSLPPAAALVSDENCMTRVN